MKLLLTHGYFLNDDAKELQIMKPYVPLGILYISAFLEKNNISHDVFDSTFSDFEKLCLKISSEKYDAIGIYVNLMTKLNVLKIIRFVKSNVELKHTRIILGGPEVRHHAKEFLKHGADIIVIGEGEQTMFELLTKGNLFSSDINTDELENINGIAYLNHDEIVFTNPRENLKHIDELPFPNRKKVNLQLYIDAWKNKHGKSAVSVSTMRGCPYTCKWCSRAVYGQTYRRRSAKLVADELLWINQNYNADSVWFVDDVFTISHKWLQEFRDEIVSRKIKVSFECITRADRLNEDAVKLLKDSGCFRVWIGAESGSQKIIDAMDRRVDVNRVSEMILLAKKYGIESGTFIMVGYPGETMNDIEETIEHLKRSQPDHYTITIAYPIKGTPLYMEVENDFTEKINWEQSTDRMIDFKRTHTRRFYEYAIRLIYNEVRLDKNSGISFFEKLKIKLKIKAARLLMKREMNINAS